MRSFDTGTSSWGSTGQLPGPGTFGPVSASISSVEHNICARTVKGWFKEWIRSWRTRVSDNSVQAAPKRVLYLTIFAPTAGEIKTEPEGQELGSKSAYLKFCGHVRCVIIILLSLAFHEPSLAHSSYSDYKSSSWHRPTSSRCNTPRNERLSLIAWNALASHWRDMDDGARTASKFRWPHELCIESQSLCQTYCQQQV